MAISITKENLEFFLKVSLHFIKLYRLFCYTTYTYDMFPVVNPYNWPLSFINALTRPYFKLIKKLFNPITIGPLKYDISSLTAFILLEAIYREVVLFYFVVKKL